MRRASGGGVVQFVQSNSFLASVVVFGVLFVVSQYGYPSLRERSGGAPVWRKQTVLRFAAFLGVPVSRLRHGQLGNPQFSEDAPANSSPQIIEDALGIEQLADDAVGDDRPGLLQRGLALPTPGGQEAPAHDFSQPAKLGDLPPVLRDDTRTPPTQEPPQIESELIQPFVAPRPLEREPAASSTPESGSSAASDTPIFKLPAPADFPMKRRVAPSSPPLPASCRVTAGWHMNQDRACYLASAELYAR